VAGRSAARADLPGGRPFYGFSVDCALDQRAGGPVRVAAAAGLEFLTEPLVDPDGVAAALPGLLVKP
jgi:hypothetical protein